MRRQAAQLAVLAMFSMPAIAIDIPAGLVIVQAPLWSHLCDIQTLYDFAQLGPIRGNAVRGERQPLVALALMLAGTGWTFDLVNERTVALVPIPACRPSMGRDAPLPPCHVAEVPL